MTFVATWSGTMKDLEDAQCHVENGTEEEKKIAESAFELAKQYALSSKKKEEQQVYISVTGSTSGGALSLSVSSVVSGNTVAEQQMRQRMEREKAGREILG